MLCFFGLYAWTSFLYPSRVHGIFHPIGVSFFVNHVITLLLPYYGMIAYSMIAKIITHGQTREDAVRKMIRALDEMVVEGIQTNLTFQHDFLSHEAFESGEYTTETLSQQIIPDWFNEKEAENEAI